MVPALKIEWWAWNEVRRMLDDPMRIIKDHEERKGRGEDTFIETDLENVEARVKEIDRQISNLTHALASIHPAAQGAVCKEISSLAAEKEGAERLKNELRGKVARMRSEEEEHVALVAKV